MDKKIQLDKEDQNQPLIHDFNRENIKNAFTPKVIALLAAVIVAGVLTGYMVAGRNAGSTSGTTSKGAPNNSSSAAKGTIIGSNDTATFNDTAEGTLQQGGINGEGAYHLIRSGGPSQNVYLTSSIVDLSKFIGKKIKVWGQTQKAQYAGWLMDVGRVQVL